MCLIFAEFLIEKHVSPLFMSRPLANGPPGKTAADQKQCRKSGNPKGKQKA